MHARLDRDRGGGIEGEESLGQTVMAREKRVGVEGDGVEGRAGVTFRSPNYVVEMRLSIKAAEKLKLKLHLGSYETVDDAMVARDYGAYLRNSTGKEDRASVGGFRNSDVIFKFEESPEVFESLEGSGSRTQARCDELKSLLELQTPEACIKLCKGAREDIKIAIELRRSRYAQTFLRPQPLNRLPNAEPVDGEMHRTPPPSSSEVRVSPTPGPEVGASMGEGSTSFIDASSLQLQTILMSEHCPTTLDRIKRELSYFDKWFEGVDPCAIEPESIAVLE